MPDASPPQRAGAASALRAPARAASVVLALALTALTGCADPGPPPSRAPSGSTVDLCRDPAASAPREHAGPPAGQHAGPHPRQQVEVQFLGVAGFLIRAGDDALLTPPFYSNPGLVDVLGPGCIEPDPSRIPTRPWGEGLRVHAILVGHAHYDHLMDVPALVEKWGLEGTPVFGSRTAANLLRGVLAETRGDPEAIPTVPVNATAGTWQRAGAWHALPPAPATPRFRVMALHSQHAPHFQGIKVFDGYVEEPTRPCGASDWKEGQTLAWLIDVLAEDGETVLLRLHYRDSASTPPLGQPPPQLLAERPADVAILCAASFEEVQHYPEATVRSLGARYAIAGHWEDFFGAPESPPQPISILDLAHFERRLRSALPAPQGPGAPWAYTIPHPGDRLVFEACAPRTSDATASTGTSGTSGADGTSGASESEQELEPEP